MPRITTFMDSDSTWDSKVEKELGEQVIAGNIEKVAETISGIIKAHNDAIDTLESITTTSDKLVKLLNHAADLADTPEVPPKKKRSA